MSKSRSLDAFFKPDRVAIIGLSRSAIDAPISILTTLKDYGYGGEVHIINPKFPDLAGYHVHASLDDAPPGLDLAVVTVAREQVNDVLRACIKSGIGAAIVITQGLADADDEGKRLQDEMVALARDGGLRILGPNTIGVADAFSGFTSSFIEAHRETTPIGLIAQSGLFMMGHNIVANEPAGFCLSADLGNACDVSLVDLLDYYEAVDAVEVVQCHLEGIVDGRAFVDTAARVSKTKPIVALKAGRSETGQVAVASHSGAAAGEDAVYRAAFHEAGVIVAENAEELRLLAKAFARLRPPQGNRVAVMSFSGGGAILAIDAIEGAGLTLATFSEATNAAIGAHVPPWLELQNPLDIWIPVAKDFHTNYPAILEQLLKDDGVDAVICIYCSYTMPKYMDVNSALYIGPLAAKYPDKPVLGWSYGMDIAGMTEEIENNGPAMVFPSLDDAGRTLAKLSAYAAWRDGPAAKPAPIFDVDDDRVADILGRAADTGATHLFSQAFEILDAYGLPLAPWRLAADAKALDEMAGELSYPVCMKVVSDDIVHKSDSGGIVLGIDGPAALLEAHAKLLADVTRRQPGADVAGVLVQAMAGKGKEVMIGAKQDPVFGPCLIVGAGGIYTEVVADFAFRLAPIGADEAAAMIDDIDFAKILHGVRGEDPCHLPSIVDALLRVSQLVVTHPAIREIDINPIIVDAAGALVVDARIIL
jgi:acetate---CoA ligase (ADP-forming)